jgi:hypothetical protein
VTTPNAKTLKIQLRGKDTEDEHLRLPDFIDELRAIFSALQHVGRMVAQASSSPVYYRVVNLTHSSPASVELEAVGENPELRDYSDIVFPEFIETVANINRGSYLPRYSRDLLTAIYEFAAPLSNGVTQVRFSQNGHAVELLPDVAGRLRVFLEADELTDSSVFGMLEYLNLHNGSNTFRLYPAVGGGYITCTFKSALKSKVCSAAGKYIRVEGVTKTRAGDIQPYEISVRDVEVMPTDEKLPKMTDLYGMAPSATKGKPITKFLKDIRRGW